LGRKKKKKKEEPDIWDETDVLHGIVNKKSWDFISHVNKNTAGFLTKPWCDNLKINAKSGLWEKFGGLADDCFGLAKNKAIIGVGSGPSLNKNIDVLRERLGADGIKDFDNRNYVTICSNHQYKPLLNQGIIPDFVMLVDASDVVYEQLCVDVPDHGKNTTLICGLHCAPKMLDEWDKQGKNIRFYVNSTEDVQSAFKKHLKCDPKKYSMEMGGNVLNAAFVIGSMVMRSFVFLAVGNDLSVPLNDDIDKQRDGYYADGDYSTNAAVTGTGRDEAKVMKRWAGFNLTKSPIKLINPKGLDRYNIELDLVGTSHTLWVYKTWLESTILRTSVVPNLSLHYFNCTEGGILGVMTKDVDYEKFFDGDDWRKPENWYLLDEKCRCYHTALLEDAMEHFDKCKEVFERGEHPLIAMS